MLVALTRHERAIGLKPLKSLDHVRIVWLARTPVLRCSVRALGCTCDRPHVGPAFARARGRGPGGKIEPRIGRWSSPLAIFFPTIVLGFFSL